MVHRNQKANLFRRRELTKICIQPKRYMLPEQATIDEISPGDLEEIDLKLPKF